MRIDWVHESNSWDGPISGWLRAGGSYYYFSCPEPDEDIRVYEVFDAPRAAKKASLQRVRAFRHEVGWHCDRAPGQRRPYFDAEAKPNWRAFYDKPALNIDCSTFVRIGTTTNLAEIVLLEEARS